LAAIILLENFMAKIGNEQWRMENGEWRMESSVE
jgi:hypothetical protein